MKRELTLVVGLGLGLLGAGSQGGSQVKNPHGDLAADCGDCHKDPHGAELGPRCETCHTPRTWTNQREVFRAHNRTRFPLFAVHANVD